MFLHMVRKPYWLVLPTLINLSLFSIWSSALIDSEAPHGFYWSRTQERLGSAGVAHGHAFAVSCNSKEWSSLMLARHLSPTSGSFRTSQVVSAEIVWVYRMIISE